MSGHTEGPWKVEIYDNGGFAVTGRGGHGDSDAYVVCSRGKHALSDETSANGHLISAAPELLAVAQMLIDGGANAEVFSAARAAIAKALGQPQ